VTQPPRRTPGRAHDDSGSALIEFVGVTVVLLVPLVYLMLTVFTLQRAAFAVAEGARDAGRAVSLAGTTTAGLDRAQLAAAIALQDQGLTTAPQLRFTDGGCARDDRTVSPILTPGARYEVCVAVRVPLPFTGNRVLGHFTGSSVTVTSGYLLVVPPYEPSYEPAVAGSS
jgi:Flp pilus assembly protein TadG